MWKLGDAPHPVRDQRVAWVGPGQHGRHDQPLGQPGRHVLHRVHREIDGAAQQRLLDLLGEQPLAADVGQQPVGDAITGGLDHLDHDRVRLGQCRRESRQALADEGCLRQRQRRAARADAERQSQTHLCRVPLARWWLVIDGNGIVLGIETSCDETAVALVRGDGTVLAAPLLAQLEEHAPYGGVVPEIAARAHVEKLDRLIQGAMRETGLGFPDLTAVAATAGPGLIGGLIVGLLTGKAIARVHDLPFAAINHLEAHALTARLTDAVSFPYLLLLVSGGHCQLVTVEGVGRYRQLGTTQDDALGEAYDKVAKMLGLGYPGGPRVEAAARTGNPTRFRFPRPLHGQPGCDFSFSGLKTAVRQQILRLGDTCGRAADRGRPVRQLPGRGRRRARGPHGTSAGPLHEPASRSQHAGRCRRRCRQPVPARAPGPSDGGERLPPDRPATPSLRRQRRHGGLGRHRAAAARPRGRPGPPGPRPLAARDVR